MNRGIRVLLRPVEIAIIVGIVAFLLIMIPYQLDPNSPTRILALEMIRLEWWARPPHLLVYLIIFAWTWQLPLAFYLRRFKTPTSYLDDVFHSRAVLMSDRKLKLYIAVTATAFVFLRVYPYLRYDRPIGIDAGQYLLALRTIEKESDMALSGANLGPSIWYLLAFAPLIPFRLLGASWEMIVGLSPVFSGATYIYSNYLLAKTNAGRSIGLFAAIFSALSLSTQWLTVVAYRNAVGLSALIFMLWSFLGYFNSMKRFYLITTAIAFAWLAAQYPPMALVSLGLIFLFLGMNVLSRTDSLGTSLRKAGLPLTAYLLIILIPSIVGALSGIGRDFHLTNFSAVLTYFLFQYAAFLTPEQVSPTFWIARLSTGFYSYVIDSPLVLLLASVGMFTLLALRCSERRAARFRNMLLSWYVLAFSIMMISPVEGYRMIVNYPLPILSAIGLAFVLQLRISINIVRE